MNLLDRLKPQYREKLDKYSEAFPTIAQGVYDELSDKKFIGDIRYGVVHDLQSACDYNFGLSPYVMFNEYK